MTNIVDFNVASQSLSSASATQTVQALTISQKIVEWSCAYADEAFESALFLPDTATNAKRDVWRGGLRRLRAALRKELGATATADMKAAVAEEALEIYRGRYLWDQERLREIRARNAAGSVR